MLEIFKGDKGNKKHGSMMKNKFHSYKYYSPERGNPYRLGLRVTILQTYIYTNLR